MLSASAMHKTYGAGALQLAGAASLLAAGALETWRQVLWISSGVWMWPSLATGTALVAGALACVWRRAPLAAVVATLGMASATAITRGYVSALGSSLGPLLTQPLPIALFASCGAVLGASLLSEDRARSGFAPISHRRILLAGAVAAVASASIEATHSAYLLHSSHGDAVLVARGVLHGSLAILQSTCAIGVLRMRGIALLLGLVAASLGTVISAASGASVFVPQLICSTVAALGFALPLLRRRAVATDPVRLRVRVETPECIRQAESLEASPEEPEALSSIRSCPQSRPPGTSSCSAIGTR